jgi:hypothetical protein
MKRHEPRLTSQLYSPSGPSDEEQCWGHFGADIDEEARLFDEEEEEDFGEDTTFEMSDLIQMIDGVPGPPKDQIMSPSRRMSGGSGGQNDRRQGKSLSPYERQGAKEELKKVHSWDDFQFATPPSPPNPTSNYRSSEGDLGRLPEPRARSGSHSRRSDMNGHQ